MKVNKADCLKWKLGDFFEKTNRNREQAKEQA